MTKSQPGLWLPLFLIIAFATAITFYAGFRAGQIGNVPYPYCPAKDCSVVSSTSYVANVIITMPEHEEICERMANCATCFVSAPIDGCKAYNGNGTCKTPTSTTP